MTRRHVAGSTLFPIVRADALQPVGMKRFSADGGRHPQGLE